MVLGVPIFKHFKVMLWRFSFVHSSKNKDLDVRRDLDAEDCPEKNSQRVIILLL